MADKSRIMTRNKAFMIESLEKDQSLTPNGMIDEEIARDVIQLNGENNKKKLDKSKQKSW